MGNEQAAAQKMPSPASQAARCPPSRRYPRGLPISRVTRQATQPRQKRTNEASTPAGLPVCTLAGGCAHHSELGEVGWCYGGEDEEGRRLGWKGGNGTARRGLKRTGGGKMLARSSGEWKATKARWGGELDALLLPPLEGKSLSLFSLPNLCWFIYMPHTHTWGMGTHTHAMSSSLVYLLWN